MHLLNEFLDRIAKHLPKSVEKLRSLKPFNFGQRPDELKGITSGFAIEHEDADNDYIYYGEVLNRDNDVYCGKGVRAWITGQNKALLIGWFRNNIFTGYGLNIFESNLQYYEGDFFKFKYHGRGKICYGDRREYEGEFKNGEEEGIGTCRFANGQVYVGSWKDGKMNGKGKMTYVIEQYEREGEWR